MAFTKTGAPEKQKVVLAEEEIEQQDNGQVVNERELDTELVPEDDKDERDEQGEED